MSEKIYNKLIRDRIPEIIMDSGGQPVFRIMEREEFIRELKNKLVEEANEVVVADTHEKIIDELADVQEVLRAIYIAEGIDAQEVEVTRTNKAGKRGGFEKRLMLEKVEE